MRETDQQRIGEIEVSFLPPEPVDESTVAERSVRLSSIISDYVIPRLLQRHASPEKPAGVPPLHDTGFEVRELARLVQQPDDEAGRYILKLRDTGISLDRLHVELLEPAARYLGELWHEDKIDFLDVTVGVSKLQRLVYAFEGIGTPEDHDTRRKVLIAAAPGDQHSFGTLMVQKFLRASGWHVWSCTTPHMEEAADVAAQDWFGVVGFSLSSDVHLDRLSQAIERVRALSMNRHVGIMVGGSAIARNPEWVAAVGADGTAANAPAAVILAKKLLVAGLARQ